MLAMRSTSRSTGALFAWACFTNAAMRASTVSDPTAVATATIRPDPLTEPPTTSAPGETSTGRDSPVTKLRSNAVLPDVTFPSVATRSPGRTTNCWPTRSCDSGTSRSTPASSMSVTRSTCRRDNAATASTEVSVARASSHRPSNTKVMTTAETSAYTSNPPTMA